MGNKNKYRIVALLICISIFCFNYWLAFPGVTTFDTKESLLLSKSGWHPVIWSYILQFMFFVFGKHVYFLLILSLVPFYLGVYLILMAFYNRYRTWFSLLAIFPVFIGNIFLINFHLHSSSLSANWIFLLYAECFWWILSVPRRPSWGFLLMMGITFVITTLSRHNAFIQVIPVSMMMCFMLLPDTWSRLRKICCWCLGLCLPVVISMAVSATSQTQPASSTFLWHIAAACVPADDATCFQKSWYIPDKNWKNIKEAYFTQNDANWASYYYSKKSGRIFIETLPNDLKKYWLDAVVKYPINFLLFQKKNAQRMWGQEFNIEWGRLPMKSTDSIHPWIKNLIPILEHFPRHELYVKLTPHQDSIFDFLHRRLPKIPPMLFLLGNVIAFIFGCLLFYKDRKNYPLIFVIVISFWACVAATIYTLFTPNVHYRYTHPILISNIFSVCGLIAYLLDVIKNKRKIQ